MSNRNQPRRTRRIKPATMEDATLIAEALRCVKKAVAYLKYAGADKAAARVRSVLKSVEGANRHVIRRVLASREVRDE